MVHTSSTPEESLVNMAGACSRTPTCQSQYSAKIPVYSICRVGRLKGENLALQQQSQAPPPPVPGPSNDATTSPFRMRVMRVYFRVTFYRCSADNFGAFDLVLGAAKRQNEELEADLRAGVCGNSGGSANPCNLWVLFNDVQVTPLWMWSGASARARPCWPYVLA